MTIEKFPLVSVVIPMYNAAKFIPQTLESLLYQTMTDFEVVIVDDCSTDDSVRVVENYSAQFGGRLHVIKLPKNTGTPGLPRNVGIQFAHGKYIAFLDSDDLYTKTALEELSTLAEQYQAEVVRLWRRFTLWNGQVQSIDNPKMTDFAELTNPKNFSVMAHGKEQPTLPMFESTDIGERVRKWLNSPPNDFWGTGLWFYRRDFLIVNQIFYPDMPTCEDLPIAFKTFCLAKKILNVPNSVYIIRPRAGSVSREGSFSRMQEYLIRRMCASKKGMVELENIMDNVEFFRTHPSYRYAVLKWFGNYRISTTAGFYFPKPPLELYPLLAKEFHPDDAAFATYLFNTVNLYWLKIFQLQAENNEMKRLSQELIKRFESKEFQA